MSIYHSKILQLQSSEVNQRKKPKNYQNEIHGEFWWVLELKIKTKKIHGIQKFVCKKNDKKEYKVKIIKWISWIYNFFIRMTSQKISINFKYELLWWSQSLKKSSFCQREFLSKSLKFKLIKQKILDYVGCPYRMRMRCTTRTRSNHQVCQWHPRGRIQLLVSVLQS